MTDVPTAGGAAPASLSERWGEVIMASYGTPPLTLVSGSGAVVRDDEGHEYVDLLAGIAVNALGHAHPAVLDAVTTQLATLGHVSNLYVHPTVVRLAERLLGLLGRSGKVFFCNSGAEANEAVFKLARRTGRPRIVAAAGAFHGRTMGALALTGQPGKRDPFLPLPGEVTHVPYGDGAALESAVRDDTAVVLLEPILGEAGVVPAPEGYLSDARRICDENGALLALDEVQTGIGRTGEWFDHQDTGIRPDIITLAKGLGGGLPIGACVAFGEAADLLQPGMHGTTFGGNPVVCAAALAVLDTIEHDDLLARVKVLGARLTDGIECLDHPLVAGVRGRGLLLGVVLTAPVAKQVEAALRRRGFLVNACTPEVVRLAPPFVLTDRQVADFLAALPVVLDSVEEAG